VARDDLEGIVEYIADDSLIEALSNFEKIRNRCASLCKHPSRGRVVPELKAQGVMLYRQLVIAPWRVIYRVSDQTVFVLAVIDSRRNMEDILLQRFVRGG